MKWRFKKDTPDKITHIKSTKRWFLLIPFILLMSLLVVVPLILIFIKAFLPTDGTTVKNNWEIVNNFIINKIIISLIIAAISTIVCILISYPFTYFLANSNNKTFKVLVIFIATAPVWTSFLVKLVGLKTFFDICAGYNNSTYGQIWTVIGLVYLYLPFMIMPLYTILNNMPKNLVYASYDLGCNSFQTFCKVVLPYTKTALASGVILVFLPALTTVAVPQFLNNNNDSSMVGDIIVDQGQFGLTSDIAMARASTLSLVLSLMILSGFIIWAIIKKIRTGRKTNE